MIPPLPPSAPHRTAPPRLSRGQTDPDHATGNGDTPAILAARSGHICALYELEEAGADLDRSNFSGETPLIVASREGRVGVVAFLAGLVGTDLDR